MPNTKNRTGRWLLAAALAIGGTGLTAGWMRAQEAQQAQPQQVATVDSLKTKALEALRAGKFELTNDYLTQAAAVSNDPSVKKMAEWSKQFETQRLKFVSERLKEYEKAAKEVNLLVEKKKPLYAMEVAARAYLLAEDKAKFRGETWVNKLLADGRRMAGEFEKGEDWIKAMRVYSQLSAVEPENAEWKDHLKTVTRRVRLLALYVPEELKKIQEDDIKEREEVEQILRPATRPTTKPAEEEGERQRIHWRDQLKDVKLDMLTEALVNARSNYYRDVPYNKMIVGGLQGLKVVATTPALERTFPGLGNPAMKGRFLGALDQAIAQAERAKGNDEQEALVDMVARLKNTNDDTINLPEEVFASEFADGAFAALDPFSSVIWPNDWEEFKKTTSGEFSGVGIQIGSDDAGYLKVISPLEDTPAYRAGIKPESLVTHINGKPARWLSTTQAVKLITGPPKSTVVLTVKGPNGDVKDYTLVRETIKVASVKGWLHKPGGGWEYFIDPDQKIGYVRLTNFSKTTSKDVKDALTEMQKSGARGVIFDLRYNPGGLLNAATEVVDRFISDGMIVSTRPDRPDSPNRASALRASRNGDEVALPLIVLVNQYSASASEIVSGALKDHHRAIIVGERTFGKGSVQMLYPLAGQQAVLKLTTSHYYLPAGKCIHREENSKEWGVEPDLTVEMTPEQMRAAIDARQDSDILRDADPAQGANIQEKIERVEGAVARTKERKDPLAVDAQLSAALLLMRLQLAGGAQM